LVPNLTFGPLGDRAVEGSGNVVQPQQRHLPDFVILISAFDRTAPCKSTFTAMSAPFTYNVNTAVIIK
jgi:hypothetical protein